MSILAELIIPGCWEIELLDRDVWRFSCGLRVSDTIVGKTLHTHGQIGLAHARHHAELHTNDNWQMVENISTTESAFGHTFSASFQCSCHLPQTSEETT